MSLGIYGMTYCPLCGDIVLAGHLHRCRTIPVGAVPSFCWLCGTSLPVSWGPWRHECRPLPGLHSVVTYEKPSELPELLDDHAERLGHLRYTREAGKPFSECRTCHEKVRFRGEGL